MNIGGIRNLQVQKADAQGNILWTQTYLPAGSTDAAAYAITLDEAGNLIVTGRQNTGSNGVLLKYDAAGTLLWVQSINFLALSVTTDEDGNIYLSSWNYTNSLQTSSYNPSGILRWTATLNLVEGQVYRTVYKGGFVYITGGAMEHPAGTPPAVKIHVVHIAKFNSTNGSLAWSRTYSHSDKIAQTGYDLVADASGNVYAAGDMYNKSGGNQNLNWVVVKYNATGTQQWAKVYDGPGKDYYEPGPGIFHGMDSFGDIEMDNGGNLLVTGTIYTAANNQDLGIVKINSAGTQVWEKSFDGSAHLEDAGSVIATDASSNIFVGGSINKDNTNSNAVTLKYNSSGVLQASDAYDGGNTVKDQFTNITTDVAGNIYVAGASAPYTVVIKYNSSPSLQIPLLLTENISIKLYPVPAKNHLTIEKTEGIELGEFIVTDVSGRVVYQNNINRLVFQMDISRFAQGVYFLKLNKGNKIIKFIKE